MSEILLESPLGPRPRYPYSLLVSMSGLQPPLDPTLWHAVTQSVESKLALVAIEVVLLGEHISRLRPAEMIS